MKFNNTMVGQFKPAVVVGVEGDMTCSALPHDPAANLADRAYFQRALLNQRFAVGDFQVGRVTGQPSINFGYPLLDDEGQVRAVLFSALDLGWLNRTAGEAHMVEGGNLTVLDHAGTVLAHFPDGENWVGQSLRNRPVVQRILTRGSGVDIDVGRGLR